MQGVSSINLLCHSGAMRKQIWVNIGSGNGVLADDSKLLPEPMLTNHHLGLGAWGQYRDICPRYEFENY